MGEMSAYLCARLHPDAVALVEGRWRADAADLRLRLLAEIEADNDAGRCWARPLRGNDGRDARWIRPQLGCSARTVARAIDQMIAAGLIIEHGRTKPGPRGTRMLRVADRWRLRLARHETRHVCPVEGCGRRRRWMLGRGLDARCHRCHRARQRTAWRAMASPVSSAPRLPRYPLRPRPRQQVSHRADRVPTSPTLSRAEICSSAIEGADAGEIDGRGPPIADEEPDPRQCWLDEGRDRWLTAAKCARRGCGHGVPRRPRDAPAGRNRYCRCCWDGLCRRRDDGPRTEVRAATDRLDAAEARADAWDDHVARSIAAHRPDARRALATCRELEPVVYAAAWARPALDDEARLDAAGRLHRAERWLACSRAWLDDLRRQQRSARRHVELCRVELADALDAAGPRPAPPRLRRLAQMVHDGAPDEVLDGSPDEIAAARAQQTRHAKLLDHLSDLLAAGAEPAAERAPARTRAEAAALRRRLDAARGAPERRADRR